MTELRRILLVALCLALACAVFWMSGAGRPGLSTLHKWYWGCVAVFLPIILALMVLAPRGRLERSIWPILVGAVLGWVAACPAYLIYFGFIEKLLFKPRGPDIFGLIVVSTVIAPIVTFSWLLGALAGAFFALPRYLLLRRDPAKPLGIGP